MSSEISSPDVGGEGSGISSFIRDTVMAYRKMEMEVRRYLLIVVLPSVLFLFGLIGVVSFLGLSIVLAVPTVLFGVFGVFVAAIYPKLTVEKKQGEIEEKFHLYATHMTILAQTNIDRVEVFRKLAEEEEYGALTEETRRIVETVVTWNKSLDDALDTRANQVPSELFSDFLNRLAYSMNAGQTLSEFLKNEQESIISDYITMYQGQLENIDVLKDLYLSMILSMSFAMVFAIVLPILIGTDPMIIVSGVGTLFVLVQVGFLYGIYQTMPYDPIWFSYEESITERDRKVKKSFIAALAVSILFLVITALLYFGLLPIGFDVLPLEIYLMIMVIPFLVPGIIARRYENKIKARDEDYPDFVRSLGAVESAKQSPTTKVLEEMREEELGELNEQVDNLYKRLNMRIEPRSAWRMFTAECGSYLIQKFSDMYLVGREMGGETRDLGELISENFKSVLQLREERGRMTVTVIGVLYGMTAAMSFALFLGFEIVAILTEISKDFDLSGTLSVGKLLHGSIYNLELMNIVLLIIVFMNALMSSLMVRIVDGGRKINASIHFVALNLIGCFIGLITSQLVGSLLNIN